MRLARSERREQLLDAATRAFARSGFAATSLDDVATEAGVSRVILYRHFESKADLYRTVLARAAEQLATATESEFGEPAVTELLRWAEANPAGFRLLFHHAAREPDFRAEADQLRAEMVTAVRRNLTELIPDRAWADWAAQLGTTTAIEAIMAWLDAGRPDPDQAANRIGGAVAGVIQAARPRS